MTLNFINFGGKISTVHKCLYDSNIGYSANLNNNGDVDNWTYYDGIHTYGCWNGFLFGTIYKSYACIGMGNVIHPIKAEKFYNIKLIMKFNMSDRARGQSLPTHGKIMWRTLTSTLWNSEKSKLFEIKSNADWNVYEINMSEHSMWQGDINDLRIFPVDSNGKIGDEFFIRAIEVYSNGESICSNTLCDYYSNYSSNCRGTGKNATCASTPMSYYIEDNILKKHTDDRLYSITEDRNILIVNINDYGDEIIKLSKISSCSGYKLATIIANEISKVGVGGYSEVKVTYNSNGEFSISTGTYTTDSKVVVKDSALARYLCFYTYSGDINFKTESGRNPASGFTELSSFKVKTNQLYNIIDGNTYSGLSFDPQSYNIEVGRKDWLSTGLGDPSREVRATESDTSNLMSRYIDYMDNAGKTIIDFNHPANASGRIKKIYAAVTLDTTTGRGALDYIRKETQLKDACIMFFRPDRAGNLKVLPYQVPIKNREHDLGKLYSSMQEYIEMDCDIFLNEGDLIGVYNANIHVGRSVTGKEIDATYYHIEGKPTPGVTLQVDTPLGNGSSGIMIYARSNRFQDRLLINVDFGKRVNVSDLEIVGKSSNASLDFNIARCVDIKWEVDLFGGDHTTGYETENYFMPKLYFNHPNIAYGVDCLTDGIKVVPDGLSADSFSVSMRTSYESYYDALHEKDGGAGVIPQNPKYFHCNGDLEWIGVYMLTNVAMFAMPDFQEDPIAFTIKFPMGTKKTIYKSKIYFKERYNFRNFGLSTYIGEGATTGNADNKSFNYIPNRGGYSTPWVRINLDGLDYRPEDKYTWSDLDLYLAENPCNSEAIIELNKVKDISYDPILANYTDDNGMQYSAGGKILNNEQFIQAAAIDWTIIEHEWEPISTQGFRIYCDNHKSTKICEMELYCKVDDAKVPISSAIDVSYSDYGDYWWSSSGSGEYDNAVVFIGDSPRYINISIKPVSSMVVDKIGINISNEDFNFGNNYCGNAIMPVETKIGYEGNSSVPVSFRNIYGPSYDLYVDIVRKNSRDAGIVFYSLMSDDESISSPEVGPNAYYKKHPEYIFKNYNKNVAINCPVYTLRNIAKGAHAWRTYDKDYSWQYFGVLDSTHNINFSNLPNMTITTLNLPNVTRSKWWKIGFLDNRVISNIREMQVYFKGVELSAKFYYSKAQDVNYTPNNDPAPHLNNHVIDGSYYILGDNAYVGIELEGIQEIDKIIIYHDRLLEYENSHDKAGIDSSTSLCVIGEGDMYQTDSIFDYSYYEHPVEIDYGKIYCDNSYSPTVYYEFTKDFVECEPLYRTFDGDVVDTNFWKDIVNSVVASGVLNISNYKDTGTVSTVETYVGDFSTSVDLSIEGAYNRPGWGCYLQVENDVGSVIRVGRDYRTDYTDNCLSSYSYGPGGWETLTATRNSDTSNIALRLYRSDDTIECYVKTSTGIWWNMGSSTVIGTAPVTIKLLSSYSPIASGITLSKFDNFFIDKSDSSWAVDNSYGSVFTCVSGIGPSGNVYQFDIKCANHSNAAGYKIAEIFDVQNKPLDNNYAFVFDFTFKMDQFLTNTGVSTNDCGVSVGVFDRHEEHYTNYSYDYVKYFVGAQVVITRDTIGIATRNLALEYNDKFVPLQTASYVYFCRFTSDGSGNYTCKVWTDYWLGNSKVADIELYSNVVWTADKIGVGSGFSGIKTYSYYYRALGWISDIDFSCSKSSPNFAICKSSIRFNNSTQGLVFSTNNGPGCDISKDGSYLLDKAFTIDFYIKFKSLPKSTGQIVYIAAAWDTNTPPVSGATVNNNCSWALVLEVDDASIYWRFYMNINSICVRSINLKYTPDLYRWNHYYVVRGSEIGYTQYMAVYQNGRPLFYNGSSVWAGMINKADTPITIGVNLDGWLSNFRISSDRTKGGSRLYTLGYQYQVVAKEPPIRKYERYYTYTLHTSSDNMFYGKIMDVDVLFNSSKSCREPFSLWSESYYSYFAIDLGQRYNIDIIRSYPIDTSYQFNTDTNTIYSNKDTDNPLEAFYMSEKDSAVNDGFDGENNSYPNNWTKIDSDRANSYVLDGMLLQSCSPNGSLQKSVAASKFMLSGDFDLCIDFDLGDYITNKESWFISIGVYDVNNQSSKVVIKRGFYNNQNSITMSYAYGGTWTNVFNYINDIRRGTIRLNRKGYIFSAYVKKLSDPFESFELLGIYQNTTDYGIESVIELSVESNSTSYPYIQVLWDNFKLVSGNVIFSNKLDARWVKIKLLNGDGVTRNIINFDVFPNITVNKSPSGGYNTYWDCIGSSVTSYSSGENIALSTTISGSSYVYPMIPDNAVNGIISNYDLNSCWGSANETNPWLTVYFDELQPIYRIKVFHGYDINDSANIITDYNIQYSTDNVNFTTLFSITSNTSYERTHDLMTPVYASSIRLYVTAYKSINRFIKTDSGHIFWKGAVLREIEVYKYYGYNVLNSEDTPIIAIDLKNQYYIEGHELIGTDSEYTMRDWDNSSSNFAWSNDRLDSPSKVNFSKWGTTPIYERWVAIKRNTATKYPTLPGVYTPETDKTDYLKHVVIKGTCDEDRNNPNPIEYYWMWDSNISELSNDYNLIGNGKLGSKTLKILYPGSTEAEHIRFIEGDHFGWDTNCSIRDGLGINLYIDDISSIDLDYGYIYVGGTDYTEAENPIIFKWYISSIKEVLVSGWNQLFLCFMFADDLSYTKIEDLSKKDPRRIYSIRWGKMGIIFKGKGKQLQLNIEGSYIARNYFAHTSYPGQYGLYLHNQDLVKTKISNVSFDALTIEFWIRPDWDIDGRDIYKDYKLRTLFHVSNNSNDIFGAQVSNQGIEVYYGNVISNLNSFIIGKLPHSVIDNITHFGFVCSNSGRNIDADRSSIRVYINNNLAGKISNSWEVSDNKHIEFVLGGQGVLPLKHASNTVDTSAVDGVVSKLKVYNFCKTDFEDSVLGKSVDANHSHDPNDTIYISPDNVTFYGVSSEELPLVFEDVPYGEEAVVWVKTVPVKIGDSNRPKRTANIISSWDIGV